MAKGPKGGMADDEEMDMGSNDSSSEDSGSEVEISIKKSSKGGMVKKAKGGMVKGGVGATTKKFSPIARPQRFSGLY